MQTRRSRPTEICSAGTASAAPPTRRRRRSGGRRTCLSLGWRAGLRMAARRAGDLPRSTRRSARPLPWHRLTRPSGTKSTCTARSPTPSCGAPRTHAAAGATREGSRRVATRHMLSRRRKGGTRAHSGRVRRDRPSQRAEQRSQAPHLAPRSAPSAQETPARSRSPPTW